MSGAEEFAIVAQDVGVKYDLRLKRRRTLRHTVAQIVKGGSATLGRNEFWALRDVSFALPRGEVLAVVGGNGSGKSTLLQTIAGVLRPDAGALTTYGRSATLLALGAGFEIHMTGRENIYLNAAYLGFLRERIDERVDEIIAFSELGQFIDAPVATYSSGMRSRLAFSIAAYLEPEILLLDEILGVGDVSFRRKSRRKLQELMDRAEAIVIVSHNAKFVTDTATRALWLDGGRLRAMGDPAEVMEQYEEATQTAGKPMRAVA